MDRRGGRSVRNSNAQIVRSVECDDDAANSFAAQNRVQVLFLRSLGRNNQKNLFAKFTSVTLVHESIA